MVITLANSGAPIVNAIDVLRSSTIKYINLETPGLLRIASSDAATVMTLYEMSATASQ